MGVPTGLYVESLHQYFEKYLGCNNATGSIGGSAYAGIEMHANMTYTLDAIIHKNLFNSFVSDR